MSERAGTRDVLPASLPPRGLRRPQAAAYCGVSPSKFDEMVRTKVLPAARRLDGIVLWDRRRLDEALDCFFDIEPITSNSPNPWDRMN